MKPDNNPRLGTFYCSLGFLRKWLGLPNSTEILHVEMVPYGMGRTPCCRVVLKDENLPPVGDDEETTPVAPQLGFNGEYRQFKGYTVHEQRVT